MNIYQELLKIFNSKAAITIFDIGSCEADDSLRYAQMFPYSKVYAFEPIKENFDLCVKNTAEHRNIKVFNYAVSNKCGVEEMWVSSGCPEEKEKNGWNYGNKSSSLLEPKEHLNIHKWCKFKEKQFSETTTIKYFCNANGIKEIDYLHLDSQGSELMVLQGAYDFIKNIKVVFLEVEAIELYLGQPLKSDIEKFMEENGFTKIGDTVDEVSGDQLWVRK